MVWFRLDPECVQAARSLVRGVGTDYGGTFVLARVSWYPCGLGRALDLLRTGREISAETALAMGLVTEVVASGEHVTRALEIAERIASFPQATLLADRWGLLEGLGQQLDLTATGAVLGSNGDMTCSSSGQRYLFP